MLLKSWHRKRSKPKRMAHTDFYPGMALGTLQRPSGSTQTVLLREYSRDGNVAQTVSSYGGYDLVVRS